MRLREEDYIHGGLQKDFYEINERVESNCLNCGSQNHKFIDEDRGLQVAQCLDCNLIYTRIQAKDTELNYFGDVEIFKSEARLIFNGKKSHHRDKNYQEELDYIKSIKPKGKLLDIGTNMGFFLRIARKNGFEVFGVEPSPSLANIAIEKFNLNVFNGFLNESSYENSSFDVVTLIDVFEHITLPHQLLEDIKKKLKDDGILLIKVPNGDYNYFKMKLATVLGKKSNHDIWDCCEHVGFYNYHTLSDLLKKHELKITKFKVSTPINPPVWAEYTGHYFQYPSPFILDWKRILLRKLFYLFARIELSFKKTSSFAPDLMFIIQKN